MITLMGNETGLARKKVIAALAALALILAGGYAWHRHSHEHEGEKAGATNELYTCGMHPWIISDKPGDCPICGMKLTKLENVPEKGSKAAAKPAKKSGEEDFFSDLGGKSERKILFYRNPMNPAITSKAPAKDEMGMDYVPVYEEEPLAEEETGDRAEVRLDDETIRRTGLKTAPASYETLTRAARAVGRVTADETRIRVVTTKIGGWIEKLHVNYLGQKVQKGQPLITLYSPELLATQEEYLRAKAAGARLKTSSNASVAAGADDLTGLAASRLRLFDVPDEAITALGETGKPQRTVTLKAPISGYVTGKDIYEGSRIEPGMPLLTVTDLERIWVEADFYEHESAGLAVGAKATLTLPNNPGVMLTGRVAFISPVVNPETRTVQARFEFPNSNLELKPGMFADVSMTLTTASGLVIPDSALIDTGVRQLVYVETETGVFAPRQVTVSLRSDSRAVIAQGLKAGERVVTRANFLLDSESRLRSTINRMTQEAAREAQ